MNDRIDDPVTPPPPIQYERITFAGRRPVLLRVLSEGPTLLVGIEIHRDGSEVTPVGADERTHVIDKMLIVRRQVMHMNRHYGELEPMK